MLQVIDPETTYSDEHNLYTRYLVYHKRCGGLLLVLPDAASSGDTRMLIDSARLCHCYDHVPVTRHLDADQIIARILNDLARSIGTCETVADAQQLVWKLAAGQEVRE